MPTLKNQAIQLALQNSWEEAIRVNLEILEENSKDIDCLKRLAYAYMQSGSFKEAEETYKNILSLDSTNPIATKNLKKLATLSQQKNGVINVNHSNNIDNVFIQEAGKTKTVDLTNVADKKTLMNLHHGDDVVLIIKRSKIFAQTPERIFIGMLPDNVGLRLTSFIKGGNEYQACVKSVDDKNVTVFVKEVKRAKKFTNIPSFT